jgi:hypothetical protein
MKIRGFQIVLASLAIAGAVAAGITAAHANGAVCSAYVGGLDTSKSAVPELVVFNVGAEQVSLSLTLRDASGSVLANPAAPVVVDPFHTAVLSLTKVLATASSNGKPYEGRFSLEVAGATPFGADTAVVHVTQYLGTPAKDYQKPLKPKAAYVVRAQFSVAP